LGWDRQIAELCSEFEAAGPKELWVVEVARQREPGKQRPEDERREPHLDEERSKIRKSGKVRNGA
jgi:hypothetical protein